MNNLKDKKGFTLVELLAVIVILALIMGIAAYSMQGVTENVRISSMKSSALSFIDGVRTTLLSNMELKEGDYYFNEKILEADVASPWGGSYVYKADNSENPENNIGPTGVKAYNTTNNAALSCSSGNSSFVRVKKVSNGVYSYEICLFDSNSNFVFASEKVLNTAKDKSDYYTQESGTNAQVCIATSGKIGTCPQNSNN